MTLRKSFVLFAVVVVAACGGAAEEPAVEAPTEEAPAEAAEAPMSDAEALDEQLEYFVTHYNMHHPDMVAELYQDDAVFLSADGSVLEGREAIQASMAEAMANMEPTLDLEAIERIITDQWAVTMGRWSIEGTPEGAEGPMMLGGHYMSASQKVDGEWLTMGVITNYDQEPPPEAPRGEPPAEAPPDVADSPLAELAEYWATHYNMQHADMVASRYTEDAMVAFANRPLVQGRDAVAEQLAAAMEEGEPQITIHEVDYRDIGDGWILSGGWYEQSTAQGDVSGGYMGLSRPDAEGNMQIHWHVSNGHPVME